MPSNLQIAFVQHKPTRQLERDRSVYLLPARDYPPVHLGGPMRCSYCVGLIQCKIHSVTGKRSTNHSVAHRTASIDIAKLRCGECTHMNYVLVSSEISSMSQHQTKVLGFAQMNIASYWIIERQQHLKMPQRHMWGAQPESSTTSGW